jgi:hypothetical protein
MGIFRGIINKRGQNMAKAKKRTTKKVVRSKKTGRFIKR